MRSMLKALGLYSPFIKRGNLRETYKTSEKSIQTDILIISGGTASTIAAIQPVSTGRRRAQW